MRRPVANVILYGHMLSYWRQKPIPTSHDSVNIGH